MRRLALKPLSAVARRAAPMACQRRGVAAFLSATPVRLSVAAAAPAPTAPPQQPTTNPVAGPAPSDIPRALEVTSANFDTEVLQSQIAVCLVFHCNTHECRQHIKRLEEYAHESNTACKYHWLKITVIDADRCSNMASAFSVERAQLPLTFFAVSGTIIDKVSGRKLSPERLASMVTRFRDYYQKSKGVELIDHGPFLGAKPEKLTEGATTVALETQLVALLVSASAVSHSNEEDLRAAVDPLLSKALKQSVTELDELKSTIGSDVKKMDEEESVKKLYKATAYISAAHVAALHSLYLARLANIIGDAAAYNAADDAIAQVGTKYTGAAGTAGVRRVTARAELIQAGQAARIIRSQTEQQLLKVGKSSSSDAIEGVALTACKRVTKLLETFDTAAAPSALQAEVMEPVIADIKSLMGAARLAKQRGAEAGDGLQVGEVQALLKVVKRAVLAVLALYSDDPVAVKLRARLASLFY